MMRARGPLAVLLVAPLPPPRGGIGTWTESMIAWTSGCEGVRVHLVNTAPRRGPAQAAMGWRRLLQGASQACRDLGAVLAELARQRPDALHLATSGGLAVARDACVLLLARSLRVRSVYHLHFGTLPQTASRRGVERAAMRIALGLPDVVVALDQASAEAAAAMSPAATVVQLPHFIDAAAWSLVPRDAPAASDSATPEVGRAGRPRVLYAGWVNEAKGLRELITACARIAARHDIEVVLAGPIDPAFRSELAVLAGSPSDWLRPIGEVAHEAIRPLMAAADIVVLPSRSEGFPYVVLEAMSMGRPVVATAVGAIPHMLVHEGQPAGEVVPPRDAAALERAIERLLADPAGRATLGALARRAVEQRFTIEAVRAGYLSLWNGRAVAGAPPATDALR